MKKLIMPVILVFIIILNCHSVSFATTGVDISGGASSGSIANNDEREIPLSYRSDMEMKIDSVQKISSIARQRTVLSTEERYISPYVTSVKNQGSYGTCWAFSFIAASEASIMEEGLVSEEIDLSEWQLAYFLANSVVDPLGGTSGDRMDITKNYLEAGANQQMATYRVANWYGLVDETIAPYETVCQNAEAALPDEAAYDKDVVHLENAFWVSMQDQNVIKQMIQEYGACGASYYSDGQYYNTPNLYNTEVAEYCPEALGTNHGITIVGWDDAYSKDNFGTYKPEGDGAWYCKNSWGTGWGADGYFWISYEDAPLSQSVGYFYDYGRNDNFEYNYQYDGGAWSDYYDSCPYEANMYMARGNEQLKAIGFYTRNPGYNCTISVYKKCTEGNPISGELVAELNANQLYAGFHTVRLENEIPLNQDDCFSVVIKQTTASGACAEISVDSSYEGDWCTNISDADAGQSFISINGERWYDISAGETGKLQNCRIKAYTDDAVVETVKLTYSGISLMAGDEMQLNAIITPQNAKDKSVQWTSSDEKVATVSSDGTVTAIGYGEAVITCTAMDRGKIYGSCKVSVVYCVSKIELDQTTAVVNIGESLQLTATVTPEESLTKGVYWISDNIAVAVVDAAGKVSPVSAGTAVIKCAAKDGGGQIATCQVTVCQLQQDEPQETVLKPVSEEDPVKAVLHTEGEIISDADCKAKYKVTNSDVKNGTVEYMENLEVGTNVVIPAAVTIDGVSYKVTSVAENAFKNHKKLTRVTVGNNVVTIGTSAFSGCRKLTTVILGRNVKTIGASAFSGCRKLKTVSMGKNVTAINAKAFYKCIALTKIVIPAQVNRIGKQAFYGCKKLKNITIKTTKLTGRRVGSKAFKGIYTKAAIKVPKKKWKMYRKLLKARGIGSKVKVKK